MTLMARWTYYSPFSPLEAHISKSYCIQLTVICFPFLRWARGIRVWDNNGCRGGPRSAMTDCRILDLVTRLGPVVWPHYHQCYNPASPQSALCLLLQLTDIGVEHGSIDIVCFDNDPHWPSLRTDPTVMFFSPDSFHPLNLMLSFSVDPANNDDTKLVQHLLFQISLTSGGYSN